jgi:hypothetical protein
MLQALSNLDDRTSKLKNLYLNMAVGEANRQYKLLIAATVGPAVNHKGSRRKDRPALLKGASTNLIYRY